MSWEDLKHSGFDSHLPCCPAMWRGGQIPHKRGEPHPKWPQPVGENSSGRAGDRQDLPTGTWARMIEQHAAQLHRFKNTCSLHKGRRSGSDIQKAAQRIRHPGQ